MNLLTGKKALITGLASQRSIAYGIARAFHQQGAELAFSYQTERLKSRVEKMANEWGTPLVLPCDVSSDDEIENLFTQLKKHWDHIDILIHSIAFAPAEQLAGDYAECIDREGFRLAHDISSYSFSLP